MGSGASSDKKKHRKSSEPAPQPPLEFGSPAFVSKTSTDTGLSILEIETLVRRFRELGCTDDGIVQANAFEKHSRLDKKSDNLLFKRFVTMLPQVAPRKGKKKKGDGKKKGKDRQIDFASFTRVVRFWKLASASGRLVRLFDLFDLDDNGLIDLYDLRLLLADTQQKYPNAIQDLAGAAETLYTAMGGKDNKGIAVDVFCAWAKEIPPAELDRMFGFDIVDPDFVDFDDPHMLADSGTNVVGTKSTMSSMKASYTGTSMPSRRGSTEAAPASAADPPSTPPPQPAGGSMFVGGGSPVSEASPGGHDAAKNLGLLDLSDTGPVTLDLSAELPVENVGAGVGASAGAGVHSEGGTEEKADVAAASI